MDIYKFTDMIGGWFVGDFEPSSYKTDKFEVCYKFHKKGEKWDKHYHKEGTEINLLVEGKIRIQNKEIQSGEIFVMYPYEVADPEFLEDCKVIIIKTPSIPGDKYIVND